MGKASVNPISGCHLTSSAESNKVKLFESSRDSIDMLQSG